MIKGDQESWDTAAFRRRGNKFINEQLSNGCKEFLASKGLSVQKIRAALGELRFWRIESYPLTEVSSLPGVVGTFGGATYIGDWSKDPGGGILLRNDLGQPFPHVLFNQDLFGQRTSGDPWHPDLDPFHEALHWASGRGDSEFLIEYLGYPRDQVEGMLPGQPSRAISYFFAPNLWNCSRTD